MRFALDMCCARDMFASQTRNLYHIAAAQQLYRICRRANISRPQSGHIAQRHRTVPVFRVDSNTASWYD